MLGGVYGIYQIIPEGLLKISSSIINADDTRDVGTYIPESSPIYQKIVFA